MSIAEGSVNVTEQAKESAKLKKLLPTESDFKGMPGYYQKPAKVWRRSESRYVDGYEWGVSVPTRSKQAREIGEAIAPHARAAGGQKVEMRGGPVFGVALGPERPGDFCERCDLRLSWCECNGGRDEA